MESLSGTSRPCQGIRNDTGLAAAAFTPGKVAFIRVFIYKPGLSAAARSE